MDTRTFQSNHLSVVGAVLSRNLTKGFSLIPWLISLGRRALSKYCTAFSKYYIKLLLISNDSTCLFGTAQLYESRARMAHQQKSVLRQRVA